MLSISENGSFDNAERCDLAGGEHRIDAAEPRLRGVGRRSSQEGGQRRRRVPSTGVVAAVCLAAALVRTLLASCCRPRIIVESPLWEAVLALEKVWPEAACKISYRLKS